MLLEEVYISDSDRTVPAELGKESQAFSCVALPRDGTQVPHCRQSLCQVSHQGSPWTSVPDCKMLPGDADVQLEVGASSWTHTR